MNRFFLSCLVASVFFGHGCVQKQLPSELSDKDFFFHYVYPKAEAFSQISGLPFPDPLTTNMLVKWKFDYLDDTQIRVYAHLYFTNRLSISVRILGTNGVVNFFRDSRVNPGAIAGRDDPREAKFVSNQRDLFTEESALEFAARFFKAAGHDPKNFRLSKAWHMGWGDPKDKTDYFPLPFYEFVWFRKDIKKVEPGESHHPHINIVVSGLTRTVAIYERLNMPVCGDFDDCSKK